MGRQDRSEWAEQTERAEQSELVVLASLAQELAGEFRLQPLLEKIVRSAVQLLGCTSGSICTIDHAANLYRKEVDLGVGCQAGKLFPLDEGVTGAVVRAGASVVFDDYSEVPGGHIAIDDVRYRRRVIGVPIRLQSTIIGAVIVFADSDDRAFSDDEVKLLELFATHAAIAIANSRLHQVAADRTQAAAIAADRERTVSDVNDAVGRAVADVMLRLGEAATAVDSGEDPRRALAAARKAVGAALDQTRSTVLGLGPAPLDIEALEDRISQELDWVASVAGVRPQFLVVGERRPASPEITQQLLHIVQEALTNVATHARARSVRVGLVYGPERLSAIIEDDGVGFDVARLGELAPEDGATSWGLRSLVSRARQTGGVVQINSTASWGTRVQADLPYGFAHEQFRAPRWRVLVVHDRPVVRAGIVRLLAEAEPNIQVVGEVGDPERAIEVADLLRPDVVLVDIDRLADAGAFIAELKSVDGEIAVVLMIGSTRDPRIRDAARHGARGFIDGSMDGVSLGRALISAASGGAMISGELLESLGAVGAGVARDGSELTAREDEVRLLVERGLQDKQIAAELGISVKTVEKHVGTILRKTGAKNRTMLAAFASRQEVEA